MFNPESGSNQEQANWHPPENQADGVDVEKGDKQQRLVSIRAELDKVADSEGKPIDPGIFETDVGLMANDINTTQSCEGHDDGVLALPWADVGAPEPENWENDPAVKEQWTKENIAMTKRLGLLLEEWKSGRDREGRNINDEHALELHEKGIFGAARLESASQEQVSELTGDERAEKSKAHRKIMEDFGDFFKEEIC